MNFLKIFHTFIPFDKFYYDIKNIIKAYNKDN